MRPLNLFLARFDELIPVDQVLKQTVREVINQELDHELPLDKIKINRRSVYLEVSPALKNLIFLHRERLAEAVRSKLGETKERKLL